VGECLCDVCLPEESEQVGCTVGSGCAMPACLRRVSRRGLLLLGSVALCTRANSFAEGEGRRRPWLVQVPLLSSCLTASLGLTCLLMFLHTKCRRSCLKVHGSSPTLTQEPPC
jgi:hypothetical protein